MSIKSDKWIKKMSLKYKMIEPFISKMYEKNLFLMDYHRLDTT